MPVDLDIVAPPITPEYTAGRLGFRQAQAGENAGATSQGSPAFTITRIDSTTVQVDFAASVLDLPTLRWPGAYVFDPPLDVRHAEPGPMTEAAPYDSTLRVTLTTDEQGPFDYELTVFGLERL